MQKSDHKRGGAGLRPIDPALMISPVDYLNAVHLCEREVCAILERIAERRVVTPAESKAAMSFLSGELLLHLEDEEQDLFPLLRLRCEAEDDIERLLGRLQDDHRHADFDVPRVADILRSTGSEVAPAEAEELCRFANHARRHLILENAVLIPFARLRLTEADLETLCASMRWRRGLEKTLH